MENRQQQILSEIKEMMSSIRVQLEQLDAKMAELQYEVDPQEFTIDTIDLELEEQPVAVQVGPVDDLPFFDDEEPVAEPVEQPEVEVEPEPELVMESFFEPEPVKVDEPVTIHAAAQTAAAVKTVVLDAMTAKQAWRTDMPGATVRDVRSAISLNDRVLFINRLFGEDPVAFQETLTAVNQMATLDEAVDYLVHKNPSWDLDSELVYRFMMAIRRKIN